ncbi:LysR family transcriptional regulator [Crenobacter sp. SG2303]|uniref:LysR family transcriptional regulator n=1 Tax=Crenobacter oryzisoli TaxID=3056844 RepID=A0ABT7XPG0_9NEIS|nr:LysR family transcriptional regulator [Crenobacter sp. SG2303]MDN0075672.1 LysR family transcriptional regulator [Crenobacter sp. SG2303]
MQPDLNDLYYFAQVVDHRGFAPAGRALGIPKSKLSRRIALLEEQLGVRLLQRSTRRFSVTDVGQHYYAHCKAMLVEAEAAQQAIELMRTEPCGVVRLACPVAMLHSRVGAMLADFLSEHPAVTLHLEATNRRVDVIDEGFDLAIRVRVPPLEDSGLVMKLLGERSWCLVASPALLARHGTPTVPADLHALPSLDLGPAQPEHLWQLDGPDGASATLRHRPRLVTDDMLTLRQAALAGNGVVTLPTMMVDDALTNGSLVRLLPHWHPKGGVIHAVFPSRRGLLPGVRALLDYLADRFAELDEH